jgi:CRP-like cAMP-binding protein
MRLKELKPLHEEYLKLEAAEQALAGVGSTSSSANGSSTPAPRSTSTRSASTRSTSSRSTARKATRKSTASKGTGKRGRPKGSGNRGNQALELVRAKPGITIPELAEAMGIKQNYLYRVMPGLAEQGLVSKSGRGWHVKK